MGVSVPSLSEGKNGSAQNLYHGTDLGDEAALDGGALLVTPLVPQRPAQDVADDQDLAAPGHSRDAQGSSRHGPRTVVKACN